MSGAGMLNIRACWQGAALTEIQVELRRPTISRLFINQLPEAVLKAVPYLYTLCAEAQRAAAQLALAAARDEAPPALDHLALWRECLHEHLWRLLLDWPIALGLPAAREAFIAWRAQRLGVGLLAASEQLLSETLWPLATQAEAQLPEAATATVAPEPALQADDWLAYWQGSRIHSPLPGQPESVAAAYRGRLAAVMRCIEALRTAADYPLAAGGGNGQGVGQVLTARGVLTHALRLGEGRVVDYRVQAPTDVFFANGHYLAGLLNGRLFADSTAARQGLEQAVLALDPCLAYQLQVN